MNAFASYAIYQHLEELIEESRQARIARAARGTRPSIVRRALAAIRASVTRSTAGSESALAA